MKKLKCKTEEVSLKVYNYQTNGRLAVVIENGDDMWDVTINLEYPIIRINEGFINDDFKTYCPELIKSMKNKGIIEKSFGFINYNLGRYEYVSFNLEKLKEYDNKGVEKFLADAVKNKDNILSGIDFDYNIKL